MRGSTALFLAGAAAIVSGTVAPAFSADDPAQVAPDPAAESTSDAPPADEAAVENVDPDEASAAEDDGGLVRPTLEVDEVGDPLNGTQRDRDAKAQERKPEDSKQPLANASVTMKDIQFKPKTLTISPGDRVTWTNRDPSQHNAVDQGEFETPLIEKGESASVTIDTPGTYNYVCTVHAGMKGKLVAQTEGGGSSGGSGGSSGSSGSSGGTSSSTGSSGAGTFPSSGSSSSGGSSGSLPNTGQEQLPLLILGAGLIVAGLLARAFHEYWIWR
jgi:LPXTG-motif cell wall-anchored protein